MRDNKGFTLIELLIVVVIIGILAAIAIPKFSATREKAYFAAMKSDLKNLASQQEIYYADTYEHTELPVQVENETLTAGFGLGYSRPNLFGMKHLHINFALPVRYYFDGIEETKLGDATVREHFVVNNMWLFLGYRF